MGHQRKGVKLLMNAATDEVLLEQLEIATGYWKRLKGLMFREKLENQQGIHLHPCNSIHCFFMKFPIDVVFLDRHGKVVGVFADQKPRSVILPVKHAYSAIEAKAGCLAHRVKIGDILKIEEADDEKI